MIVMRMREQNQIDGRQIFDAAAGTFDALQQKQPIREIGIDENIQIIELNQE